ncbi:hypothetical protein lerEdw1_015925 [Lerista edwardsae]|nr:hypothetical protein lerEdw1_015925 [Lerista edwardsae]
MCGNNTELSQPTMKDQLFIKLLPMLIESGIVLLIHEKIMDNHTSVSEFLLLEFSKIRELQILHFFIFLVLYLAAAVGNLLVVSAVAFDRHLHTPMPTSDTPSYADFVFTIMYSTVPPILNPVIYSMRNKDIKVALSKLFRLRAPS